MTSQHTPLLPSIRILNRFYAVFTAFCLLLLIIGVPFIFVRKLPAAVILLVSLAGVLVTWRVSRRGKPKQSLVYFACINWVILVAALIGGLSPNGGAVALALALMLSVVVSQRAGTVYAASYLLAWLVYIVLRAYHLVPEPYFVNVPLTGWIIVAGACWLILIPIPELVKMMNQGAALQRSVFEATSDALLVVDRSHKVESYNQKFIAMWGIPDNLALDESDSAMLAFVRAQLMEPAAFIQRVAEIYAQVDMNSVDLLFFKDGRVVERFSHPNFLGDAIVGRVWSFRDVTQSHRAQLSLQSSQAKFQGLFDLSPLGMARNDMSGKFHEVNAAFSRMLGYEKDALNALSYWQITPDKYAAQEQQHLQSLQTRGTYGPFEKEYIHKSGHTFPVRLNGMLIHGPDGEPFIWSIIEDISAQKAHERSLTQAKKAAEEASLSKSEFLANMSHEIRTPMNAILGMLQLMGNTELSASQFDYLSKTEGAAKSLLGLLNDILDLSKIDAMKMELDVHVFDVDHFLHDLAVVLSASVANKSIEVLYDIDPAIPAQLVGDSLRLQQVLINLGGNAIKFTTSGQVVVSLRMSANQAAQAGVAHIDFAVQDSGIGIAPENQRRIFSDFAQAESSTTRRFGGTGLGLAITKRLIELMGGQITLTSALGQGSNFGFSLILPIAAEHAVQGLPGRNGAAQTFPLGRTDATEPKNVLIVDDNVLSCQFMASMLQARGWTVDVTHSGQQALDWLHSAAQAQRPPYDCIYVDWQMPDVDGWETTRRLSALYQHNATAKGTAPPTPKFVMLSANGRQNLSQRTQLEQNLLSAFLVKPVTASMLAQASQGSGSDGETVRKAPRSSQRQLAGLRILVVEDNAINQQVAEELLGFEGALVSIAADGRQGVHAVASAKQQFDAVLMDIQMPVMDGFAATHAIRTQLGLTRLPIIGLTANAMASDRDACMRAGMNEHIGKPFEMAQLVSLLVKLTGPQSEASVQFADAVPIQAAQAPIDQDGAQTLRHIPDIDVTSALQRLGGMRSLYVNAALQFQTVLASFAADLNHLLQTGQLQQAQVLLHTTKGNTATLGLDRLSGALRELEQLCKTQRDATQIQLQAVPLKHLIGSAQGALQQAIAQLSNPGDHTAAMPTQTGEVMQARALLQSSLIPLLMARDLAALQAFERARGALVVLPQSQVDPIDDALRSLDFDEALRACFDIVSRPI